MSSSFFKFLIVGGLGFVIDSGLTLGFIELGLAPLMARPPAILVTMTFTWLANRRHTFNIREAGSLNEAARYSVVGTVAALLNYTIYSGMIIATSPPFLAISISTAVVSLLSYYGYKYFAFGKPISTNNPSIQISKMNTARRSIFGKLELFALFAATGTGLTGAALYFFARNSFWQDEIIALTHGLQPLPYFFVEVLRNDIHPFLYFLIIKIWSAVAFGSDTWILGSSFSSAIFSAGVIAFVTRAHFGPRAALWAVALFVALPNFAWAAGNLRMYALIPSLIVLTWHANIRFLESGRQKWLTTLTLLEIGLIYTHVIEFFFVGFVAIAALVGSSKNTSRIIVRQWLIVQSISALSALPILATAIVRGAEPLPTPDLLSLFKMPAQLISGWKLSGDTLALGGGGAIFFSLLVLSLPHQTARIPTFIIVTGALFVSMIVALVGKPIFKPPVFTANLVPFLVIGAVAGITTSKFKLAIGAGIFILAALALTNISWSQRLLPGENYKAAAEYISANTKPGDVVVVPNVAVYWGILRYAVNPIWGEPLDIMPLQDKLNWSSLKKKLGPNLTEILRLNPKRDFVEHKGVRYVIGNWVNTPPFAPAKIMVVFRDNFKETITSNIPIQETGVQWCGDELSITTLVSSPHGITFVQNPPMNKEY